MPQRDLNSKETTPNDQSSKISIALGSGCLFAVYLTLRRFWRNRLARVHAINDLPASWYRKRSLLGRVISVGDGDNFRFFHTPGGYLAGWGWLRHAPIIGARKIGHKTLHIRLAGIDAPERAHFGRPAQPNSDEALAWLRSYLLGRRVRVTPLARDQYSRVVGNVHVWKLTGRKNVSREMVRAGWAAIYDGKTGAEFAGMEDELYALEQKAKKKRKGIWNSRRKVETPGEFKRRTG